MKLILATCAFVVFCANAFAKSDFGAGFKVNGHSISIDLSSENETAALVVRKNGVESNRIDTGVVDFDVGSIIVEDYNYDGFLDFSFPGGRGIVRFVNVYVFDKHIDGFIKSERLSETPCLVLEKTKRLVVGSCFHESSCENWREKYKISSMDKLEIVYKEGTMCDPVTAQGYRYKEFFESGKVVRREVVEFND